MSEDKNTILQIKDLDITFRTLLDQSMQYEVLI